MCVLWKWFFSWQWSCKPGFVVKNTRCFVQTASFTVCFVKQHYLQEYLSAKAHQTYTNATYVYATSFPGLPCCVQSRAHKNGWLVVRSYALLVQYNTQKRKTLNGLFRFLCIILNAKWRIKTGRPGNEARYRWFSWGVASLPEGKSRGLCLVHLCA